MDAGPDSPRSPGGSPDHPAGTPSAGLVLVGVAPTGAPAPHGALAAASALLDLPVPARWTWTVEAGGGQPPLARLDVRSIDAELTAQARAAARVALDATVPWLLWADSDDPPAGDPRVSTHLVAAEPASPADVTAGPIGWDLLPALWAGIHHGPHRTRLTLALTAAASEDRPAYGTVRLASDSGTVLVLGRLLAAALSRFPGELRIAVGGAGPTTALDETLAGPCLAVPALLEAGWPSRPPTPAAEIVERLLRTSPPHTVVFGGSGLGKTTLLEALVESRLAEGRAIVVLDPHGDLAARAAASATALGVPVTCLDFGDADRPPPWNLTRPPRGVGAREWVNELLTAIQAGWGGDADPQWFGPVYRRAMASLLLPLVSDPEGPWPLTRLADLAAPARLADPAERWRQRLRARITDPGVRRDLDETLRMLDDDREGHARPWLLSKLEPFIQHPGMRRVLTASASCLDAEALAAGRPLLVSVPSSALGDEGSTVLSLLLLRWIWNHVRRHGSPAGGLDVVIDEAQRLPVALCRELLAEGRKYGLQLRLATQSPTSLAASLRAALLTNAGTVATFRLGAEDALLVRSRLPDLPAAELCRLRPRQVAVSSATADALIGEGPAGRTPDEGERLRALHRRTVDDAGSLSDAPGRRTRPRRAVARASRAD